MTAGVVFYHAGSTAPTDALVCDGSEVSKTTYADLFASIGTLWDTFNGAAAPSAGNFRLPAQATGTESLHPCADTASTVGSFIASDNLSHTHTGSTNDPGAHRHYVRFLSAADTAWSGNTYQFQPGNTAGTTYTLEANGAHGHTVTPDNDGGNDNRPDSIVTLLCIWTI